ncbi:PIN domain-containing protein [Kocuria aegyptia]|uniref:PIN domain-containing protein n=1 Tax=Kocuria aegyptia TaxID=330943 RepID=A0ABP4W940_9MICC
MDLLLDRSVLLGVRTPERCPELAEVLRRHGHRRLFLPATVLGELLAERPDETLWAEQLELRFPGRVLPVDAAVARVWGALGESAAADPLAGLTAATARVHGLTVLTAEPGRYAGTGASVLDASPARR